jgi:hypothetical protein
VTVDGIASGADVTDLNQPVFDVGLYAHDDGDEFVNPEQLMSATEAMPWCNAALANPERYLS